MIQLYSWGTPNGYKPLIMLEETGLDYDLIPVPLDGEQLKPAYTRINPNGKIPAIIDLHPVSGEEELVVFESGAILMYLAEKAGQFLPTSGSQRYEVMQWVMFQMAGVGPMFGQFYHFHKSAPQPLPYAQDRFAKEVKRLYQVMEHRLAESDYLAGACSIADMATYPWVRNPNTFGLNEADLPNVMRWINAVAGREPVQKAMSIRFK